MASKKEKKATDAKAKVEAPANGKKKTSAEEKAAKRKARMEALKDRPEEQRPNGKQMDVIKIDEHNEVRKYAAPVKVKGRSIGCLITTIALVDGKVVSVSETFLPGEVVVKVKKGHGTLTAQKAKKNKGSKASDEEEEEEDED